MDWYVSGPAWAAIPQFAASHAYNLGDIIRPLTAPAIGSQYVYRCTTAGTSSTEPSWSLPDGAIVSTGGATFTNVTGRSAYGWAAAAGNLYSMGADGGGGAGGTRFNPGDRCFLSSDHSESISSWYKPTGTANFGVLEFISVNRAGSVPPVATDVTPGAAISTSSNPAIVAFINLYWEGINFTFPVSGTVAFNSNPGGPGGNRKQYYKHCTMTFGSSVTYMTSANSCDLVLDNTPITFGATGQYIASNFHFQLLWMNTANAIGGSTIPLSLFKIVNNPLNLFTCRGIDLSAITGTLVTPGNSNTGPSGTKLLLDSCKIAPAVTRLGASTSADTTTTEVELVNCFDGTNVINERHTSVGDLTTDRITYLTSGAQDDIGNYSLKLTSNGNSDFCALPLDAFAFDVENTAIGVSKTATVEITSSGTLNNNDIRLLLEYMGAVSYTAWNPADLFGITLSNNNLTATFSGGGGGVRGTNVFPATGKFYWEVTLTTISGANSSIGLAQASASLGNGFALNANTAGVIQSTGGIYVASTLQTGSALGALANGDVIGIAVDFSANLLWMRKAPSGNWNNNSSANPATGVGGFSISSLPSLYPCVLLFASSGVTANFGASAFTGSVPSGFAAGFSIASTMGSLASFADSLPSVLTAASALPSSSNTWTTFSSSTSYATWDSGNSNNVTLSGGSLIATGIGAGGVRSTLSESIGKYYWEVTMGTWTNSNTGVGITSGPFSNPGTSSTQLVFLQSQGTALWINGSSGGVSLGSQSSGAVICIAVDVGNSLIWFRSGAAGNWNGSSSNNPATGVGGASFSTVTKPIYALWGPGTSGDVATANFGASSFVGAVPSGFTSGFSTTISPPSVKQLLQVTFTPQRAGRVRGLVRLGKPSTTVWVNPGIAIT